MLVSLLYSLKVPLKFKIKHTWSILLSHYINTLWGWNDEMLGNFVEKWNEEWSYWIFFLPNSLYIYCKVSVKIWQLFLPKKTVLVRSQKILLWYHWAALTPVSLPWANLCAWAVCLWVLSITHKTHKLLPWEMILFSSHTQICELNFHK